MLLKKLHELSQKHLLQKKVDVVDLRKYIIKANLENTDRNYKLGNQGFNTADSVFIDSLGDINNLSLEDRIVSPTAYAISNGTEVFDNGASSYWLRSAFSNHTAEYVTGTGVPYDKYVDSTGVGVVPSIRVNLELLLSTSDMTQDFVKIDSKTRTMKFGYYPKMMMSSTTELEEMLKFGKLVPTGKKYFGGLQSNGKMIDNLEYKHYDGERYVRVKRNYGTMKNEEIFWFKVCYINWYIKNWNDLPKLINPDGNGTAKFLDLRAEQAIIGGIPFYPKMFDENNSFWQNSTLRGFLNGINVCNITTNGNSKYCATHGGNFAGKGFLQEAFVVEPEIIKINNESCLSNETNDSLNKMEIGA